jgi:electron transport complex protein RnfG
MLKLYIKLGVPMLVICIVAAAGLAATWSLTKDRIAEQDMLAKTKSLGIVLPDATFVPLDPVKDKTTLEACVKAAGEVRFDGAYRALDGSGQQVGWGVLVAGRGYGGPLAIAVGVDRDGKVTGVTIVSMNETPGLGDKVVKQTDWLPGFVALDTSGGSEAVRKVDSILGATKSSRGVKSGVTAAAAVYDAVLKNLPEGGSSK